MYVALHYLTPLRTAEVVVVVVVVMVGGLVAVISVMMVPVRICVTVADILQ